MKVLREAFLYADRNREEVIKSKGCVEARVLVGGCCATDGSRSMKCLASGDVQRG